MPCHAFTRVYFEDEAAAKAEDAVLPGMPAGRRPTPVATREARPGGGAVYRFDVRLQSEGETVFFDV